MLLAATGMAMLGFVMLWSHENKATLDLTHAPSPFTEHGVPPNDALLHHVTAMKRVCVHGPMGSCHSSCFAYLGKPRP